MKDFPDQSPLRVTKRPPQIEHYFRYYRWKFYLNILNIVIQGIHLTILSINMFILHSLMNVLILSANEEVKCLFTYHENLQLHTLSFIASNTNLPSSPINIWILHYTILSIENKFQCYTNNINNINTNNNNSAWIYKEWHVVSGD